MSTDEFKSYRSNGTLREKGLLINGKKHGEWRYWSRYGLEMIITSYEHGVEHGRFLRMSDGDILEKGNYFKGRKHGKWFDYGANQEMYLYDRIRGLGEYYYTECSYRYGLYHGKYTVRENEENGEMITRIRGRFFRGMKHGTWMYFGENGELRTKNFFRFGEKIQRKEYINGNLSHCWTIRFNKHWYPNGRIHFFRDNKTKEFTRWTEDGCIDHVEKPIGKLTAITNYYPNGNVESELMYYGYEEHGRSRYYDEEGNVVRTEVHVRNGRETKKDL